MLKTAFPALICTKQEKNHTQFAPRYPALHEWPSSEVKTDHFVANMQTLANHFVANQSGNMQILY